MALTRASMSWLVPSSGSLAAVTAGRAQTISVDDGRRETTRMGTIYHGFGKIRPPFPYRPGGGKDGRSQQSSYVPEGPVGNSRGRGAVADGGAGRALPGD